MKYPRPPYLDPSVPTEKKNLMFSSIEVDIPKFDTPITPLENFKRAAARNKPLWVPCYLTDYNTMMFQDLVVGERIGPDFSAAPTENFRFKDWFGADWTWVVSAGGPMLTPGTIVLDDITKWESVIKFPDLGKWDWEQKADEYMKTTYNPGKVTHINIGQGCTERLVSLVGGYTEGMSALLIEPEAVSDFLDRFSDHIIELFDKLHEYYPVNLVTYHDDWGTERDTFFSPKVMDEIVYPPTKKIIDHIKAAGCAFELHSCGNITRFLPYMIDLGVDFLQIQHRAVDIPLMKAKYGDKIGFDTGIEGVDFGQVIPEEELVPKIRKTVDTYAKGGGFMSFVYETDPKRIWDCVSEFYAYSREYYDAEQGRP